MKIRSHRELEVYNLSFDTAMKIFEITKRFPKEETYSLTDQCARIWQKHSEKEDTQNLSFLNFRIRRVRLLKAKPGSISP